MKFLSDQFSLADARTLVRLVNEAATPGMIAVELGTFTGRSSLSMLPVIKRMGGHLFCVDWFRGLPGEQVAINENFRQHSIIDAFLSNIREKGFENDVTTIIGTSERAAMLTAVGVADFIFVDADHRYSGIRQDIVNWYPKLKQGGIICGHDFEKLFQECEPERVYAYCEQDFNFEDGCHYGVIRAVSELFPDVKHEGRIWWVRKGTDAPDILPVYSDSPQNHLHSGSEVDGTAISDEEYLLDIFAGDTSLGDAHLIAERYAGYNIVLYRGRFFALALDLGEVDIRQLEREKLKQYEQDGRIIIDDSVTDLKARLDRLADETHQKEDDEPLTIVDDELQSGSYPDVAPAPDASHNTGTQSLAFTFDGTADDTESALFLGIVPPEVADACLAQFPNDRITCLITHDQDDHWEGFRKIHFQPYNPMEPAPVDVMNIPVTDKKSLLEQRFDRVIIPVNGQLPHGIGGEIERFASQLAPELVYVFSSGDMRRYRQGDFARLVSCRQQLDIIFKHVGSINNLQILDVGCRDGLSTELLVHEQPARLVGIDRAERVEQRFSHPMISYVRTDACHMTFPDNIFDLAYSIGTFEHIREPREALAEMFRVIKPGGYGFIQAGPLYFSPFGHHMQGYFDDFPWIHLRLTPAQIERYAREHGMDKRITEHWQGDVKSWVESRINVDHLNGLRFDEYGLIELAESGTVEILHYVKHYRGKEWLTPAIRKEIAYVRPEDLTIESFEILFRIY